MDEPVFRSFADIEVIEPAGGFFSKTIHTPGNTINFITVKAGNSFPMHNHVHHQSAFVLEGEFEMTIGDETKILTPGEYAIIPSGIPHAGRAMTDCKLLDIFNPPREDYRQAGK